MLKMDVWKTVGASPVDNIVHLFFPPLNVPCRTDLHFQTDANFPSFLTAPIHEIAGHLNCRFGTFSIENLLDQWLK